MVTPQYIEQTKRSLALLQTLIWDVLKKDRDYGHIKGIPGQFLWDPGASQIINAFNCAPGQRRIIHFVDDGQKTAIILEVPLVNRATGQEVASGIGAASTQETKHKYRWVGNPEEWGYTGEAIKTLKQRVDEETGAIEYRIPNPEHSELINTIVKMASKRAEVDAAEELPSVSSALKELFTLKAPPRKEPDWPAFWGMIAKMGLSESDVHTILKVGSVNDWINQGKTLDQAIKTITTELAKKTQTGDVTPPAQPKQKRDPSSIKTLNDLFKVCHEDFGLQPGAVVKELGYSSQIDVSETAAEAYQKIAAVRG